jgi:nucleoside 2-deoxyribosyltransferase
MIKAIETRYKGYRFRSRLEARWAVFFDALGLEWEYEPEGFDLGDAGWYLPDFRVTLKNGAYYYVEIKRKDAVKLRSKSTRVYLAGKIGFKGEGGGSNGDGGVTDTWRHLLMDRRFRGNKYLFTAYNFTGSFENPCYVDKTSDEFRFGYTYCGPFYDDNHGCYIAHERAQSNIKSSQVVFAWIDSEDAYGTFAEIGYAAAIGKTIVIGYSKNMPVKDMWFLSEFAEKSGVFDGPETAWEELMSEFEPSDEEKKINAVSGHGANSSILFMGDPLDCDGVQYRNNQIREWHPSVFANIAQVSYDFAAKKARAARFEHGETP